MCTATVHIGERGYSAPAATRPSTTLALSPAIYRPKSGPPLETLQHDFPARLAAFDQRMGALEVGGTEWTEILAEGATNHAGIDQVGGFGQQPALRQHIGRAELRSLDHHFPMDRNALPFQQHDV